MEQCCQQSGLRGGGVLIFVEQHMAVPAARALSDGGEALDKLIRGNGEVGEFGHIAFPLGLGIGLHQLEQNIAFACGLQQRTAMIGAAGVQMFGTVIELGLPAGVGIFLQSFDLGDFRLVLGHGFVYDGLLQSIDECRIPLPYLIDRIIEAGAAGTDHGTANGIRQRQNTVRQTGEGAKILTERQIHVTVDDFGGQLKRSGCAQWLRVLIESDKQSILAHDGLEEGVIRENGRLEECPIRHRGGRRARHITGHCGGDAFQQFACGLACEGQAKDAFRCHTSIDKRDDALGHRKGFAGTGTGNHQYVSIDWRIDDGGLFRTGSERAHACLVSKIVSIWPAQAGQTFFIRQNPIWVSCGWASMMADLLAAAA